MLNKANVIENLIYIAAIGILLIVNNYVTIGQFEGMVEAAIAKDTTEIKNEFNTEIKKLKARQGATIDFSVDPQIDSKIQNNKNQDSIPKKQGFFKKIFGKKNKK